MHRLTSFSSNNLNALNHPSTSSPSSSSSSSPSPSSSSPSSTHQRTQSHDSFQPNYPIVPANWGEPSSNTSSSNYDLHMHHPQPTSHTSSSSSTWEVYGLTRPMPHQIHSAPSSPPPSHHHHHHHHHHQQHPHHRTRSSSVSSANSTNSHFTSQSAPYNASKLAHDPYNDAPSPVSSEQHSSNSNTPTPPPPGISIPKSMAGARTVYVTNLGTKDKADLKALCQTLPGFVRVQFGQTNFRVVLKDGEHAKEAMNRILTAQKTFKASFARKEPEEKKIEELGEPSKVLWTSTLYWTEPEFRKYLTTTYEGFDRLVFDSAHSWVHFRDVPTAKRALEDMNSTTNLYSVYSKNLTEKPATLSHITNKSNTTPHRNHQALQTHHP
ncbi:hypothetical protein BC829DRAFT_288978 [Chytridium lagenaria]|nr:hypothetical protein BC829DRAFT_288978 [Chytridium lagenaria]